MSLVAPLVGAWIEINCIIRIYQSMWVAPLVGAWIEIFDGSFIVDFLLRSLPSWERGLKL